MKLTSGTELFAIAAVWQLVTKEYSPWLLRVLIAVTEKLWYFE